MLHAIYLKEFRAYYMLESNCPVLRVGLFEDSAVLSHNASINPSAYCLVLTDYRL